MPGMDAADLIRRLHEHRAWVNAKLLAAAEIITSEQLQRGFSIGQGSIWKSLLHLYGAEYVWLAALLGDQRPVVPGDLPGELPGNQRGEHAIASLGELHAKWKELEGRWREYLEGLTPAALDEVIYKVSSSSTDGKKQATRRGDVLLHVCTHAQYTTAQVVNMLRQTGAEVLPDVMLISLARQQMTR
jgi:uncharacterized damage-inducible protein DinB